MNHYIYHYMNHYINYISHCMRHYPPTPALAKAGAAPGTTAGVELLLLRRSNPSRSQQAAPRPHRVNIFLACFVLQLRLPGIWT